MPKWWTHSPLCRKRLKNRPDGGAAASLAKTDRLAEAGGSMSGWRRARLTKPSPSERSPCQLFLQAGASEDLVRIAPEIAGMASPEPGLVMALAKL